MEKRHWVVLILLWLLIVGTGLYWLAEDGRRAVAASSRLETEIEWGNKIFAANCMRCHGPVGEGVVGLPLNLEQYRGDPLEDEDTADFLFKVISRGRAGATGTVWDYMEDGRIRSSSQMPPWSKLEGGPLSEEEIKAVVAFIMAGDWENAFWEAPEPTLQNDWPTVKGLEKDVVDQAQETILATGCLTCHKIGNKGGEIGPDLSKVGAWANADLLDQWLRNPQAVAADERGPSIWSQGLERKLNPAWMPRIPLTDKEIDLLVQYLGALR